MHNFGDALILFLRKKQCISKKKIIKFDSLEAEKSAFLFDIVDGLTLVFFPFHIEVLKLKFRVVLWSHRPPEMTHLKFPIRNYPRRKTAADATIIVRLKPNFTQLCKTYSLSTTKNFIELRPL